MFLWRSFLDSPFIWRYDHNITYSLTDDSAGISAYGSEDIHAATFALQQAQRSFNDRYVNIFLFLTRKVPNKILADDILFSFFLYFGINNA